MIETKRLILRRWKDADSVPFHKLNSDLVVMEFLLNPLSLQESDDMIARAEAHFEQHGFGPWAIEVKETARLIGFTGLVCPTFETKFTPCVEIGWRLAKEFWGQGYATEAALASVAFAFSNVGLKEIVSFTAPANKRSIAIMQKLGMRHDPKENFDHPKVPEGHPLRPHVLYRLTEETFGQRLHQTHT